MNRRQMIQRASLTGLAAVVTPWALTKWWKDKPSAKFPSGELTFDDVPIQYAPSLLFGTKEVLYAITEDGHMMEIRS